MGKNPIKVQLLKCLAVCLWPFGLSYKDYECSVAADNRCDHSLLNCSMIGRDGVTFFICIYNNNRFGYESFTTQTNVLVTGPD